MDNDLKYWIAISKINKIGAQKMRKLLNYFQNMENAWSATLSELIQAGLDNTLAEEFSAQKNNVNPDEEWEKLQKENIQVVNCTANKYPKLLKEIHNPPAILYYKGNLDNLTERTLAVVGTRNATNYGRIITMALVSELIEQNIITISGMAIGIDSIVHFATVKKHKPTIAVLGSGLDEANIYPATNKSLAKEIVESGGLLISEYPFGTLALKHNFPQRNRIISGLSLGTLVIEAGEESGALITANYALDQNREVFAVPGSILNPMSAGTNKLIKKGAKAVTCVQDILEELNIQQIAEFQDNRNSIPASAEEASILKYLSKEPLHINEIVRLTHLSVQEANSTLMLLEMNGKIKNVGNMTFVANRIG